LGYPGMVVTTSSETSVHKFPSIARHIQEDFHFHHNDVKIFKLQYQPS